MDIRRNDVGHDLKFILSTLYSILFSLMIAQFIYRESEEFKCLLNFKGGVTYEIIAAFLLIYFLLRLIYINLSSESLLIRKPLFFVIELVNAILITTCFMIMIIGPIPAIFYSMLLLYLFETVYDIFNLRETYGLIYLEFEIDDIRKYFLQLLLSMRVCNMLVFPILIVFTPLFFIVEAEEYIKLTVLVFISVNILISCSFVGLCFATPTLNINNCEETQFKAKELK